MYSESHARSAAKAVSWRLLGTLTTSLLVFIFTRRLMLSLAVGSVEFVSKIGLFWMHERVWDRIRFGRRVARPAVLWFTGLSGSGKSTIARRVHDELSRRGYRVEHLDGDSIRNVFPQTGFSREERDAHVKRVGHMASRLEEHGVFVVASLISPYRESRRFVSELCSNFIEIYVSTPLEECERRDPKGLYARARAGEISEFTGIDDPYEAPEHPDLILDTRTLTEQEAATKVLALLQKPARSPNESSFRARGAQRLPAARGLRQFQAAGDAVVDRKG